MHPFFPKSEKSPNARCDVGLAADAAKESSPVLACSEEKVLCIGGTGIMLKPTLVKAVVCSDNEQGLTLYGLGPEFLEKPAEFLIVNHQALGILSAVLTRSVAQRVRFLVVDPEEEMRPCVRSDEL